MAASRWRFEPVAMNVLERLDAAIPLPDHERMLVDSVRKLAAERIAPRAAAYDLSAEFPWRNLEDMNALGLNAMFIPEKYGGSEVSYLAYLACVREISMADASTGITWATNFHAASPLGDFGNDEQKTRWLPKIA